MEQWSGVRLFSSSASVEVKDLVVRLRSGIDFDSTLQFLRVMKMLATREDTIALQEESPSLSGLSQAAGKINKVRNYVMKNFRKRIERAEVAEMVGFSSNGFSRFFKRYTGTSFVDYVNRVRVEEASRLLRITDDTVSGIAYSCGFTTPFYFNNVFKRWKGVAPGKFRN